MEPPAEVAGVAFEEKEAFVFNPIVGTAVELGAVAADEGVEALFPARAGVIERLGLGCFCCCIRRTKEIGAYPAARQQGGSASRQHFGNEETGTKPRAGPEGWREPGLWGVPGLEGGPGLGDVRTGVGRAIR